MDRGTSHPDSGSIGYEQQMIDGFVAVLSRERVEVVVDVRLNAISRKRDCRRRRFPRRSEPRASTIDIFANLGIRTTIASHSVKARNRLVKGIGVT